VPFHIVVWRIEKQNGDGRRERRGVFGGARKKGIKIGYKGTKKNTQNFEHSKGNTSRVAWCGIRRSESHRVTFQFISPSMLIASTVFWFLVFGWLLFQHLVPLF
jgi:hypothetical protein